MRSRVALGVAAAVLLSTAALHAAELKSGKQVGASVTPFFVVKQGGAPNDKVKVGQQLCYV